MVQVRRLVTTRSSASARRLAALATALTPSRVVRGTSGTASRARWWWSHAATIRPGTRKMRVARSSRSGMNSGRQQRADGEAGVPADHEPREPGRRAPARDLVRHPGGLGVEGGDAEPRSHHTAQHAQVAARQARQREPGDRDGHPAPEEDRRGAPVGQQPEERLDGRRDQQRGGEDQARLQVRQGVEGREHRQQRRHGAHRGVDHEVPRREHREAAPVHRRPVGARRGHGGDGGAHPRTLGGCRAGDRSTAATCTRPCGQFGAARGAEAAVLRAIPDRPFEQLRGPGAPPSRPSGSASPQARTPPCSGPSSGSSSEGSLQRRSSTTSSISSTRLLCHHHARSTMRS